MNQFRLLLKVNFCLRISYIIYSDAYLKGNCKLNLVSNIKMHGCDIIFVIIFFIVINSSVIWRSTL